MRRIGLYSLTGQDCTGEILWLKIGPQNGTLYGTPSSQDAGSPGITIQVSDGNGGTDSHAFTITVPGTTDGNGDDGDQDGDSEIPWLVVIIIIVIIIIVILAVVMRRR